MTQEEKDLLLRDLCARFPYGVNVLLDLEKQFDGGSICTLTSIDAKASNAIFHVDVTLMDLQIEEICPYLRPMSSMTEEEKLQLIRYAIIGDGHIAGVDFVDWVERKNVPSYIDWLNEHHFDYRGLIEKGLALEAPEGMYKEK